MKKLLALALAGTMTLSLAACGGSKADTTTTDTAAAENHRDQPIPQTRLPQTDRPTP